MVKAIPLGSSESGETSSNTSAASKHSRLSISRFRIGQKILFCLLFSTAQFLHYLCCLSRRLVAFPFERENAGGISFRNVPIFVILTRKTLLTLFFVPDNAFRQNGRPDQLIGHITNDYAVPSVNPGIRDRAIDSLHLKTSIRALVRSLYPSLWIGEAKQFFCRSPGSLSRLSALFLFGRPFLPDTSPRKPFLKKGDFHPHRSE